MIEIYSKSDCSFHTENRFLLEQLIARKIAWFGANLSKNETQKSIKTLKNGRK